MAASPPPGRAPPRTGIPPPPHRRARAPSRAPSRRWSATPAWATGGWPDRCACMQCGAGERKWPSSPRWPSRPSPTPGPRGAT
eukprot:14965746-Alexandrium_andersonii.AAC.1